MSTLTVTDIRRTGETASRSTRGVAASWLNFDGTGTIAIRDSQNIASIVDNGTGDYTQNLTNLMADTGYSIQVSANHANSTNYSSTAGLSADAGGAVTKTTSAAKMGTGSSNTTGATDRVQVSAVNQGDLA